MRGRPTVVLRDPYSPYAQIFIDAFARRDIDTICWHTDKVQAQRQTWLFPALRSPSVVAHYCAANESMLSFADFLRAEHRVIGVIPIRDKDVDVADIMAERLGLDWAQGETRRRFRDKYALKDFLRSVPGGPRINKSRIVADTRDVAAAVEELGLERFVLKPNDGFGNSRIGFFDRDQLGSVGEYFAHGDVETVLLEEYIDGDEYFINGQVDAEGTITVYSVGALERGLMNGKPNNDFGVHLVWSTDPRFGPLTSYAASIVAATGLRRSPFHMEARIDAQGPGLIEVAARSAGAGIPLIESQAHGSFDGIDVACHYFISDEPRDLVLDWAHHDARSYGYAWGASETETRIYELTGLDEVAAMPEFVRWWEKPAIGDRVERSVDILGRPYLAHLVAADAVALREAGDRVRETVRWNASSRGAAAAAKKVAARTPVVTRRVRTWFDRPAMSTWS